MLTNKIYWKHNQTISQIFIKYFEISDHYIFRLELRKWYLI